MTQLLTLSHCACAGLEEQGVNECSGESFSELKIPQPRAEGERGLVTYTADLGLPLIGSPLRAAEVWHLGPEDGTSFQRATLSLYANGLSVQDLNDARPPLTVGWSPFSLVQACRLHSVQADLALPWLRLFKVSVFHYGATHIFATQGDEADTERAHWLADVSRALRVLTQSLFPRFALRVGPLPGAGWTTTRLLAGYLLLCDDRGVSVVYCELHSHFDGAAMFAGYEDECCDALVLRVSIDLQTCVTERVGVDCSCFSLAGRHLSARTCAEKMLWLRAISNVKVKLRHCAANPTATELMHYRAAVLEHARRVEIDNDEEAWRRPLLPRRPNCSGPPPREQLGNYPGGLEPLGFPSAPAASTPWLLQRMRPPYRPPLLDKLFKEGDLDPSSPPAPQATAAAASQPLGPLPTNSVSLSNTTGTEAPSSDAALSDEQRVSPRAPGNMTPLSYITTEGGQSPKLGVDAAELHASGTPPDLPLLPELALGNPAVQPGPNGAGNGPKPGFLTVGGGMAVPPPPKSPLLQEGGSLAHDSSEDSEPKATRGRTVRRSKSPRSCNSGPKGRRLSSPDTNRRQRSSSMPMRKSTEVADTTTAATTAASVEDADLKLPENEAQH